MKKEIFLLSVLILTLFIMACSEDEEGVFAGTSCSSEGLETCSDDGASVLLCQSSVWALKQQCNISIGKRCRMDSYGSPNCLSDSEPDYDDGDDSKPNGDTDNENSRVDDADINTETENPDPDIPVSDNDEPVSDFDTTEPGDDDTEETPDHDTTETHDPDISEPDDDETPEEDPIPDGSCNSNSDCSGTTPYCSLSTSECIANAVFITEYVEGSSYNKAIEIYNGSKSPVNLSNFTIQQANNGKDWGTTNYVYSFPDSVQLNSGALYVVCKSGAGSELSAKCDDTALSGSTFDFNGDDGIALFEGSSIVDQIGNSTDYQYWSVAGVDTAMTDHTLRRKTTVIKGTTDWTTSAGTTEENSQWIVLPKDTFDGLGTR